MSVEEVKPVEMITITKAKYDKLWKDYLWLNSLKNAGVDNWSGYSYAQEMHAEEYPEEDDEH